VDYSVIPIYLVLVLIIFGIIFRKELRARRIRQKLRKAGIAAGVSEPPLLSTRLYELDKVFGPFGSDAAHPSALYAQKQFIEAVGLLALPSVSLAVVLQYVEGNSWSLASAAIAALRKRSDRGEAVDPATALRLFLGSPTAPTRLRAVGPGAPADLVLLRCPPGEALRSLSSDLVAATFVDGSPVYRDGSG